MLYPKESVSFAPCAEPSADQLAMRDYRTPFRSYAREARSSLSFWEAALQHGWSARSKTKANTAEILHSRLGSSFVGNPDVHSNWPESPYYYELFRRDSLGMLSVSVAMISVLRTTSRMLEEDRLDGNGSLNIDNRFDHNTLPEGYRVFLPGVIVSELLGSDEPGWYRDSTNGLYVRLAPSLTPSEFPDFPSIAEIEPHLPSRTG